MRRACLMVAVGLLLTGGPAFGQVRRALPGPPRIEVGAGGGLVSGARVEDSAARLRANGLQPSPYPLFATDTHLAAAPFFEAWVGYRLTRRVGVEARVALAVPDLRTSIADDVEGAADVTAAVALRQYLFEGGGTVALDALSVGGFVPFVAGGAGYSRTLNDDRTFVESGATYYAGGGLTHLLWSRPRGALRQVGLRADVRAVFAPGGLVEPGRRVARATAGASLYVAF